MNNQSRPSFTQHSSADSTRGTVPENSKTPFYPAPPGPQTGSQRRKTWHIRLAKRPIQHGMSLSTVTVTLEQSLCPQSRLQSQSLCPHIFVRFLRLSQPSPNSEPSFLRTPSLSYAALYFHVSRYRSLLPSPRPLLRASCLIARTMVSPHSSSGTGAESLQPTPPWRTISPCITSRARSLLFVSGCVSVLRYL